MKMIILAAGEGTRLRPLTSDRPKCMVEYKNKPMIDSLLEVANECYIKDIAVIGGYKKEVLEDYLKDKNLTFFTNKKFHSTNMVSTFFTAKDYMDDDIIISYSDIVYKKEVLKKLIDSKDDFSVVIDRKWKELWSQRMENPLDDAETLKIKDGKIIELGKKPQSYTEIEGQYIGLFKISKNIIKKVIKYYERLNQNKIYDGKDFDNMYMTSFIQMIIDEFVDVKPIFIDGGWIEVDCDNDRKVEIII